MLLQRATRSSRWDKGYPPMMVRSAFPSTWTMVWFGEPTRAPYHIQYHGPWDARDMPRTDPPCRRRCSSRKFSGDPTGRVYFWIASVALRHESSTHTRGVAVTSWSFVFGYRSRLLSVGRFGLAALSLRPSIVPGGHGSTPVKSSGSVTLST